MRKQSGGGRGGFTGGGDAVLLVVFAAVLVAVHRRRDPIEYEPPAPARWLADSSDIVNEMYGAERPVDGDRVSGVYATAAQPDDTDEDERNDYDDRGAREAMRTSASDGAIRTLADLEDAAIDASRERMAAAFGALLVSPHDYLDECALCGDPCGTYDARQERHLCATCSRVTAVLAASVESEAGARVKREAASKVAA